MSHEPSQRPRREALIDGRRVRLSDLLQAGLLMPNQELFFREHSAHVTDRGRLRLMDGREFTTPSGAAVAAANTLGIPGWTAWKTNEAQGVTLHDLRQRLMEDIANDLSNDVTWGGGAEFVRRIYRTLSEARIAAEEGAPKSMTVRDLLGLWRIDGHLHHTGSQVAADLANHGLATVPDFQAVHADRTVTLVVTDRATAGGSEAVARQSRELASGAAGRKEEDTADDAGDGAQIGLTLGNLVPSPSKLVSVPPTASIEAAITQMQLNDFSQLAVLAGRKLHGAVSWKSIAEAKHRDPNASFSDAIDRTARVFDYHERLLDVLDILRHHGFIFVRDYDQTVNGIVTESDVVTRYDEVATPFVLIGEVDQELRQLIRNSVSEDLARHACDAVDKHFDTIDSMTMGQYQTVLGNPSCWDDLGWPLDRNVFGARLDEVRKLRNSIMHFNPEPVSRDDVQMIRNFLATLRQYSQ